MLWFGMSDGTPVFTVFIACFRWCFASALQGTHARFAAARTWRGLPPAALDGAARGVWPACGVVPFPAWVTALGSAWKVVVMAELLATSDGVGAALAASRAQLDTAVTMGWICAVVGCLLVVEYGFWSRSSAKSSVGGSRAMSLFLNDVRHSYALTEVPRRRGPGIDCRPVACWPWSAPRAAARPRCCTCARAC